MRRSMELNVIQPSRVTVMIKPVGALCNLDCTYCYYLPTKTIYDGHEHRMSLTTLENVFASVLPRFEADVTIAWQGGEPTLAGLDFFEKMIEYQEKYRKPGQRISHALQTNGTLLNDQWCKFLAQNKFLVGLSVDGSPRLHDHYRVTNRKKPSSDMVLRGMRCLQKHAVDYNILCVLNDHNVNYPDEIFKYLLNLGSRWVQFIPAIEWEKDPSDSSKNVLAPYSPDPEAYGRFLCRVFDLWFQKYRKRVSVRIFDAVLNKLVLGEMPFCILDGSCHNQLTIEHDGAVFGCDHFVERRWQLAQIGDDQWINDIDLDGRQAVGLTIHGDGYRKNAELGGLDIDNEADLAERYDAVAPGRDTSDPRQPDDAQAPADAESRLDGNWYDRVDNARLAGFAKRKQHLPQKCKQCQWKPFCHGGCPKHRSHGGDVPEPTVLCASYMMWYEHAMPRMRWLAQYLRAGQQPPDPEAYVPDGAGQSEVASPANSQTASPSEGLAAVPSPTKPSKNPKSNTGKKKSKRKAPAALAAAAAGAGAPGVGPGGSAGSPQVGRNDPCPCGSGLKYKHCHGRNR